MKELLQALRRHGIQPTAQRLSVAQFVLETSSHPTADEVFEKVRRRSPTLSRATVYNTLNLFVEKGLLRPQVVREGALVFDPRVEKHHHFIDEETGEVHDVPWAAVKVSGQKSLEGYEVVDYQVVMRGKRRAPQPARRAKTRRIR